MNWCLHVLYGYNVLPLPNHSKLLFIFNRTYTIANVHQIAFSVGASVVLIALTLKWKVTTTILVEKTAIVQEKGGNPGGPHSKQL